ncbi:hypothetical protein [Rhizobium hainanense]|uniref:Uncharacterized protein n=1 Tax=Rhizobium hainanense TaxID=52131 RepID=A0A1C3VBA2_9HYPH|nr:hypothetical protein [Rhizobium hainanense]SCB24887.1 hypothetical protein GA0061100_105167 [Rhizobium hainanense]
MKTETKLRLSGAKTALAANKPNNGKDQAEPVLSTSDDNLEDADGAAPASDDTEHSVSDRSSPASSEVKDPSKAYAEVVKSWTSGGIVGTGRDRVTITATYSAVRDKKTRAVSLGADSFSLTITNVDTNAGSTIPRYLFSNTEWTEIPAPGKPKDAEKFHVKGHVKIDVQSSGKMMRVRFHLDTGIQLSDIGYIFVLDIPEDTKFTDYEPSEPSP